MQRPTKNEINYIRRQIKEVINIRGFNMKYYSLDLEETKADSNYSSLYRETPQRKHIYHKYGVKGLITTSDADFWNKQFGLEYVQQGTDNLFDAVIYYLTPQDKWGDDFGKNSMLPQEYEESDIFLKIVPKIGDYIRYPVQGNQFFEVTSLFPYGYEFVTSYILRLMQRPYIKSEEDLSLTINTDTKQDPNQRNSGEFS